MRKGASGKSQGTAVKRENGAQEAAVKKENGVQGAAIKIGNGADAGKRKEVTQGYTRYMRESAAESMSLVGREDLQEVLERYRAAAPSAAQSWKYRLEELCKAANAGFTADELIADPTKLAAVPDTEDRLTQMLYEMYQRFCFSDAYMARLVRNCAPEFQADSVRVAILKQFLKGCFRGYHEERLPLVRDADSNIAGASAAGRNYAYFKALLSRQCSCQTIRIEGVIEWVVDQMAPEYREAWLEKWLSAGTKEQLEMLLDQIDDSVFTRLDLTPTEELEAMIDVMDQLFTADPVAYFTEDADGVKCAITDFRVREETREAILQFMREQGLTDPSVDSLAKPFAEASADLLAKPFAEASADSLAKPSAKPSADSLVEPLAEPLTEPSVIPFEKSLVNPRADDLNCKSIDCLCMILTAGKTDPKLRETIDQKPEFYELLQADFKEQCRTIRRGPVRVPLSDAEYKAGLSEKSKQGRLTMMVKRMRTFMEGASNRSYCLWTDDHAEPITDLILDDETAAELRKFADANGVSVNGTRAVDYLNAVYEAKLPRSVLGQKDGEKEPVLDAVYRQYKEMRERIRQYPGTDTAQRKYRDAQDKIRKQAEDADSDRKSNSRLWQEILGMCDSLANARFHLGGGTQDTIQSLYYFAFMFHMMADLDDAPVDPALNIEKRLFQEYYADNLMIYLREYNPKTDSSIEYEPSGAGINYKNYAETLYLFYLYQMNRQEQLLREGKAMPDRDAPKTPGEWLDRAELMIARCAAAAKREARRNGNAAARGETRRNGNAVARGETRWDGNAAAVYRPLEMHNTRWYREKAFGKEHILLSLTAKAEDEENIIRFITENYQILPEGGGTARAGQAKQPGTLVSTSQSRQLATQSSAGQSRQLADPSPTSQARQLITAAQNVSELQLRMDEAEFDSDWSGEGEAEESGVLTYLNSSEESSDPLTRAEKKERKELLHTTFDWNVYADLLKSRYVYADLKEKVFYPDADRGFGRMIDRANDRLNRKFYGYRYEDMLRTCYLLRCFVLRGKEKRVFSKEMIRSFSKRMDSVLMMGKYEIRKSARLLKTLGFPVEVEEDADEKIGGDRIHCEWIAHQMRAFLEHPATQGEAVRRLTEAAGRDPRLKREERNRIKAVFDGIFSWYTHTYRNERMEKLLLSKEQIARRAEKYIKMPKASGKAARNEFDTSKSENGITRMLLVCLEIMQENDYFPPFPNSTAVKLLQAVSQEELKVSDGENGENPMEDMIWAMRYLIVEKLDWPRTRSEFLSVYADKYMRDLNARAERADGRDMSLLQFYEDFRKGDAQEPEERPGADELLRESRFQPISEKNFLDMYVVLSLYVYWLRIRG